MADNNPSAAEVQKFLGGISYPANKDEILEHASSKGAKEDERVWSFFERMPAREYNQVTDISKELGEQVHDQEGMQKDNLAA